MLNNDALQPIDADRVKHTIDQNFAGTYLTILGIVQNVILATFIFRFITVLEDGKPDEFFWLSSFITFLIIILVWYSYQWYPYLNRCAPKLPDSMIPFFLGTSQSIFVKEERETGSILLTSLQHKPNKILQRFFCWGILKRC
jgi:magnesium-transporting ATPase (P-type)